METGAFLKRVWPRGYRPSRLSVHVQALLSALCIPQDLAAAASFSISSHKISAILSLVDHENDLFHHTNGGSLLSTAV